MEKRCNFELFKSNVCHRLKESGDIDFLIETLEKDMIREYYNRKWYLECFYLLAMVDYISREIGAPLCSEYDDLRQQRLQKLVYPAGVIVTANVLKNDQIKEEAVKNSIPEFLRRDTPTRVLANGRGFLRHGRTPQRAITSPLHPVTSLPLSRLFCGCLF